MWALLTWGRARVLHPGWLPVELLSCYCLGQLSEPLGAPPGFLTDLPFSFDLSAADLALSTPRAWRTL